MKKKDILFLLISSVILVIAWITFSLIHNSLSSTINETTTSEIAPIPGTFDKQTIDALKKRQQVNPLFTTQTATVSAGISPTPRPTSAASIAATLTPTLSLAPTATQGGSISR